MNLHRLKIDSAVAQNGGRSDVNLSHGVLATAKIGQILPIFHEEVVPGDKLSLNSRMFARFEKLAVPSYVRLNYRTMSVFVPYHQVMDGSDSFFANQQYFKGKSNSLPIITEQEVVSFFLNGTVSKTTTGKADFYSGNVAREFTSLGRYCAKVLSLLGYVWYSGIDETGAQEGNLSLPEGQWNALPLLSFAHAYNCYLSYSANYNISELSNTLETLKRAPETVITAARLRTLLFNILLTYEESFFSSLWRNPFSSTNVVGYDKKQLVADPLQYTTDSVGPDTLAGSVNWDASKGASPNDSSFADLSAQQVRLLLKFDDFFRRCNFAGSKDVEQIYSKFGVKIDDYKTRYPYFLGETSSEVRIGDVTSTSTTGDELGAYAGKAIGDGDASINFMSNDYGMVFVFAWFAPRPMYFKGADPATMRFAPLHYYTPEMDEGFQSVVKKWMMAPSVTMDNDLGFTQLYSEYLWHKDYIVGDYTRFAGFEAWHFGRTDLAQQLAQSDSLIYMSNSGTQFERIFNITDTELVDADTIYCTVDNQESMIRPMKDYAGKSGLGHGDIDLPALGSQMN